MTRDDSLPEPLREMTRSRGALLLGLFGGVTLAASLYFNMPPVLLGLALLSLLAGALWFAVLTYRDARRDQVSWGRAVFRAIKRGIVWLLNLIF